GNFDIWKLGYDGSRWGMHPDPKTLATVIRDGNYDFLTNSQRWHNTPGGFALPNSMYLTSKPAFFGNNPWPWVDPATGATYTLPAKARYEAGLPLCGCWRTERTGPLFGPSPVRGWAFCVEGEAALSSTRPPRLRS